jgi:hypothetical protein
MVATAKRRTEIAATIYRQISVKTEPAPRARVNPTARVLRRAKPVSEVGKKASRQAQ